MVERERTRKEERIEAQGKKKRKGVMFDHYGVGFSLLLRPSVVASPASLGLLAMPPLLLLLLVGGAV